MLEWTSDRNQRRSREWPVRSGTHCGMLPRMTTNPHTAFVVEISRAAGAMAVAAAVVVATIAAVLMQVQPVWLQPWLPSAAEYTPPARLFTADELRLHDGRDPAKPVLIGLTTT